MLKVVFFPRKHAYKQEISDEHLHFFLLFSRLLRSDPLIDPLILPTITLGSGQSLHREC